MEDTEETEKSISETQKIKQISQETKKSITKINHQKTDSDTGICFYISLYTFYADYTSKCEHFFCCEYYKSKFIFTPGLCRKMSVAFKIHSEML